MKKLILMVGCLWLGAVAFGQHASPESEGCDCPSCLEKAASGFTLPGLQGLEPVEDHADCDHAAEEVGHDDHAGHDHAAAEAAPVDEHAGHDHALEGGIEVSVEMAEKVGLKVGSAQGGVIAQSVVFPTEIKLNRDRTSLVSPRYASVVRFVAVEIGDRVLAGDVLAELENRDTLARYNLVAPIDGVIISKDVALGESVGDTTVLFEVADLSSVWADISIFPRYQHLLRKGLPVEYIAPDGHTAQGVIKYISPIISRETRTFMARSVLTGADDDFTPGAFVRARINLQSSEVEVRVERATVQMVGGEPVVFVPTAHGFAPRDVQTGLSDEFFIEIISGLEPGEKYVVSGAFTLKAEVVTSGMDSHAGHGH